MYATELTPLNPKHPKQQPPQNVKHRQCKPHPLILTALAVIAICIFCYIGFVSDYDSGSELDDTEKTLLKLHQTEYNATLLQEITIHLHPRDIYYLETFDRDSTPWKDYHSVLIEAHGYDPSDQSVIYTFTMHDYHYEKEHYYTQYLRAHNEEHHDDETNNKTPRPTISRTYRPTTDFSRTPRPTTDFSRTPRPTTDFSRTPRPTISRTDRPDRPANTPRPTELATLRPTRSPKEDRTPRKTPYPTPDASFSSRHVVNGGLKCYAKYSLNEKVNSAGFVLRCNEDHDALVGCVSGSTHRPKAERAGEQPVPHGCVANGEAIYIRCCHPEDSSIQMIGKVSEIEYQQDPKFPVYQLKSWCQNTDVNMFNQLSKSNTTYYLTGCTGYFGIAQTFDSSQGSTDVTLTSKSFGTKIIRNKCRAHRADRKGFVAAPIISVGLDNRYELDCVIVASKQANQPQTSVVHGPEVPEWASMAFCHAGYSLMDCSGYVDGKFDDCLNEPGVDDTDRVRAVLFHGTDLKCMADKEQHCSANGNTDKIRAQANCCRIKLRDDNSTVNITTPSHDHDHDHGESITTTSSNDEHHNNGGDHGDEHHNNGGDHGDEHHEGSITTTSSNNEEHHGDEHHEHHEQSITTTEHENEHQHHEESVTTTTTGHQMNI